MKLFLLSTALAAWAGLPAFAADFSLPERLGYGWSNECVTFPLNDMQREAVRRGRALLGPGRVETAWQLIETGGTARLAVQVDLAPYETAAFTFSPDPAAAESDLRVTEEAGRLRLENARIGLELRTALKPGEGPLARIRLGSGIWTGGSALDGGPAVTAYAVEVTARGPVFAEAVCRAGFADGGEWEMRVRLESGEPVVRVEEWFDAPGGGLFRVALGGESFKPTRVFYRSGTVPNLGQVSSGPVGARGAVFHLEPWLTWWANERKGNWFALYTPTPVAPPPGGAAGLAGTDDPLLDELTEGLTVEPAGPDPDLLMVGVMRPDRWRDPAWKGRAAQGAPGAAVEADGGVAWLRFPLRGGRRVWMLATPEKAANVEILTRANRSVAPPAQRWQIKHGVFPLDEVKDYVLEWEGDFDRHPRLFLDPADLADLRARLTPNPAEIRRWTDRQQIDKYLLDSPIREYFASGHERLGRALAARCEDYLKACTDRFLVQDPVSGIGVAPHMQTLIILALNMADAILASPSLSAERRRRLLARIAFLGYVVNRPDYWSPARGFQANPNMTTTVAYYQAQIGCLIPSHPRAREWADRGVRELRRQLMEWSDPDGGWLEAPHYAMVSFDYILGGFLMAARAGYGDYLYEERMRKVIEWLALISTPGDSRTGGYRHFPPIGNTYPGEPTGLFGVAAGLWKARDPDFAAGLQWLHEAHGSYGDMGIGGLFPSLMGFKMLFAEHGVAARKPAYGSAWFRETGVVLRDEMGSPRETYLHLIAGSNHAHYDYDSGSILVYGKGRVLADDWGYIGRHADKWHSMLISPSAPGGGTMRIETFAPGVDLDYVSGRKGSWRRQIAFAKGPTTEAPAFFLIRDTHAADEPAVWRLWLSALERPGREAPGPAAPAESAGLRAGGAGSRGGADVDALLADLVTPEKATAARPAPTGPGVRIRPGGAVLVGGEDVDMDIFLFDAESLALKMETATLGVTCGYRDGVVGPLESTQTALIAALAARGAITALLYPRLKTEPPPIVTWRADGRGVKVETATGGVRVVDLERVETESAQKREK